MRCPGCGYHFTPGNPIEEDLYTPNEHTVRIPAAKWRKLYMGQPIDRDPLLVEREKTHGSFRANGELWRAIGNAFNEARAGNNLALKADQSLALTMIFLKIARLAQNPNEKDHWKDIAGYAKLGEEACE